MSRNYKTLTSFWFLAALLILLLNDFFLKGFFGNWLTGKLSDFSGLFVFALFWSAFFPKHKTTVFWLTGILFAFWKSAYSQPLIDGWNNLSILNVYRTVDYSDLLALLILPIAYSFDQTIESAKNFKLSPVYPIILCAFAFMATSYQTVLPINKTYEFEFSKDTLVTKLNEIENINRGNEINFTANNPDTVDFNIPSTFCSVDLDVRVVITEINSTKTTLTLLSAEHSCPQGDNDEEKIIKEFETIVIEKLKTGL